MKSGTITGRAAVLEPQNETNIWVASVDATQKQHNECFKERDSVMISERL